MKVIGDSSHANYSSIGFLKALTALRLVLESIRLRWELRVGFVALRGLGKVVMLLISCWSRCGALSRFWSWESTEHS